MGYEYGTEAFVSLATQFEDFLSRSMTFYGLDLVSTRSKKPTQIEPLMPEVGHGANVICIEDFPNAISAVSSSLTAFRESVLRYLAVSSLSHEYRNRTVESTSSTITPMVMIVSESHASTASTTSYDRVTVGRLLGPQILQHPGVSLIEFNPVAPTLLVKALNAILRKEARQIGKRWSPASQLLKTASEKGDIRSAINCIQLAYSTEAWPKGDHYKGSSIRMNNQSFKISSPNTSLTCMADIGVREILVDLFHAVGKIVYNKRIEIKSSESVSNQSPNHLNNRPRQKVSEVDVGKLVDGIGADVETFVAALHENYVLSCSGGDFINGLNGCIEALSDADLLCAPFSGPSRRYAISSVGSQASFKLDSVRHDEICFQVASRGLLFSLPHPVDRGKSLSSSLRQGRDPFKMAYPASLKIWRRVDEMDSVVDSWIDFIARQGNGSRGHGFTISADTRLSRTEMVTEYLPYIAKCRIPTDDKTLYAGRRGFEDEGLAGVGEDSADAVQLPLVSSLPNLPLPNLDKISRNPDWIDPQKSVSPNFDGLAPSDDEIQDD